MLAAPAILLPRYALAMMREPSSPIIDGSRDFPIGVPAQLPNALDRYVKRPPWAVAGIDYGVGVSVGTVLKDPTERVNLPPGCSVDSVNHVIRVSGNNVVFDGFDFSLHDGWGIYITGPNLTGTIIKNCNFVSGNNPVTPINATAANLMILNCNFGGSSTDSGRAIFYSGSGEFIVRYNYFYNQGSDGIQMGGNAAGFIPILEFNLFYAIGITPGAHNDPFQFTGKNNVSSGRIAYNTIYQPQTLKTANYQLVIASEGGSNISDLTVANNTVINTGPKATASYIFAIGLGDGQSLTNTIYKDNYFDPTGAAFGVWYPPRSWGKNTVIIDQVNMVTGIVQPDPR